MATGGAAGRFGAASGATALSRRVLVLAPAGAACAASLPPAPARAASAQWLRSPDGLLVAELVPAVAGAPSASPGCRVSVAYSARLAAKNGWVFATARRRGTRTRACGCGGRRPPRPRLLLSFSVALSLTRPGPRPQAGEDEPLTWRLGDPSGVLAGLDAAVAGMRTGAVRRVVVPPALGYLDESTKPVPAEFWQRRRLYSTVFNGTRLSNGEGDTLATTVWDVRLLRVDCG